MRGRKINGEKGKEQANEKLKWEGEKENKRRKE